MQLIRAIDKFFFKKEDCSTIGLIRISTAAVILLTLINDPFLLQLITILMKA